MSRDRSTRQDKTEKKREARSWILCLALAVIIALVLRLFVFELVIVEGPSMQPTLATGERVFVEKVSKLFNGVDLGQVVIVKYPDRDGAYVKRVVGLPGDEIAVKNGRLIRNGSIIEEDYTKDALMDFNFEPIIVPENSYYVMGDNRNDSLDSRSLGAIPQEDIIGHAMFVIWPLSEIKGLPAPDYTT